jgi:predicted 2-oxoglutarate/Fe(II)-dependent dioxygenase YbiX
MIRSDYFHIPNFCPPEVCDFLISEYDRDSDMLHQTDMFSNADFNYFDKTNLHKQGLRDKRAKVFIEQLSYNTRQKHIDFFQPEQIWSDTQVLVKWFSGRNLGVHADNAYWPDGRPNYVYYRQFSSIVYLSDSSNYEGGEFFFIDPYLEIKPEKGDLIGFKSGLEHAHGVKMITSGERYTLSLWYTDDIEHAIWDNDSYRADEVDSKNTDLQIGPLDRTNIIKLW